MKENIALRSYTNLLFSYYKRGYDIPRVLTPEEFIVLKSCDGKTEIKKDEIVENLLSSKIIKKSKENDKLAKWQKYRFCNNPLYPYMTLEITEKCNFNCLHCFAAAGNHTSTKEMSYENIIVVLDQAVECGIQAIKITGGEPMLHKDFFKIMDAIYKRGMWVYQINTNGYFLNQKNLDKLKKYPVRPTLKISYDGIGFHDKMRGVKDVDKHTIESIKRSVKSKFNTIITITINQRNINVVMPTLDMLEEIGVKNIWIVKTVETPRWSLNAHEDSFSWSEYYKESLKIIKEYIKKEHKMSLLFWSFVKVNPGDKKYQFSHVKCDPKRFNPNTPLCKACYSNVAISALGDLYPCMQVSGYYKTHNIKLENVLKTPLNKLLENSTFKTIARMKVNDKVDCQGCKFYKKCGGGACMITSLLTDGHLYNKNIPACTFFYDEWDKKVDKVLKGWTKKVD